MTSPETSIRTTNSDSFEILLPANIILNWAEDWDEYVFSSSER